jgi:hypothetical protein
LRRRLSPSLTKKLRFISTGGEKAPFFRSKTNLDNQAVRGIRELTPESAKLLDRIIRVTDNVERADDLITVTGRMIADNLPQR